MIPTNHAISAPPARVRLRRELRIDMPAERALHLFTPVRERLWVKGWEPRFPDGERGDGATVGTAFITEHAGAGHRVDGLDRGEHLVRYARTTTGHSAGLVEVRCHAHPTAQRAPPSHMS